MSYPPAALLASLILPRTPCNRGIAQLAYHFASAQITRHDKTLHRRPRRDRRPLRRLLLGADSGNIPAFLGLFTEDGVFGDTAGNRYTGHEAIRTYLNGLIARPEFRGRQHIISSLRYTVESDRIGVTAFWHVFKWVKATGAKTVEVSGHSDDAFVKMTGRWWFKQRIVHYWNDTDLPWAAPPAR